MVRYTHGIVSGYIIVPLVYNHKLYIGYITIGYIDNNNNNYNNNIYIYIHIQLLDSLLYSLFVYTTRYI